MLVQLSSDSTEQSKKDFSKNKSTTAAQVGGVRKAQNIYKSPARFCEKKRFITKNSKIRPVLFCSRSHSVKNFAVTV